MNQQDIRATIDDFLNLLENGSDDEQANIRALKFILDRLALAYHFAEDEFEEVDYPASPKQDYERLRKLAAIRFPTLGFYNLASKTTEQIMEAEMLAGDALDDVADIARDLLEVAWCWEHTSQQDALWHFRWGYENHWGEHLRDLQKYLYALRNES